MHILLVAVNAKYIHSNPAVHSLKSCAGEYAAHISILEFTINQQPFFILQEIYKKHPDVIAFSCYIWNYSLIDQMIPDLHKILPDTDFWAGGPEVSYNAPDIIKRWQLRGVMTGPGENSFCRLAAAYINGCADSLPAILEAGPPHAADGRRLLDDIPFWYEDKDQADFSHRIIYYESSRGCPFSCSYCLSSIDRTMDFRSTDRVCRELDFFLSRKVPQVKFVDRTFNCQKSHALSILKHILEHDNGITNFHFEIAADLLDEDYFALLSQMRPGAVQLEIGVQSTNARTIEEIDRRMDFGRVAAAVLRLRSFHNIHIHLDLIAGLPFEDLPSFQQSFNEIYALRPQQLQLGFLKVLKGSRMALRAPGYNLVYTSQPPYEVLSTKWLSFDDICRLKQIEELVELYYNSGQFTHTLEFLLQSFDSPYALFDSLALWYDQHGCFGIQSSRVRRYELLLEFAAAPDILSILTECLTYDLYLREHMKNRPAFCLPAGQWKDEIHKILHQESESHTLFPAASFPDLARCSYRELTKTLHAEVFHVLFGRPVIVLFYYGRRDPLTHNCAAYRTIYINNENCRKDCSGTLQIKPDFN